MDSDETTDILLPNLGLEVEEGEIVEWMVAVGERIERGQIIASIGTDKAEVELEAERDGYIVAILHEEGARVAVGTPIALIGDEPHEAAAEAPQAVAPVPPDRVGSTGPPAPRKEFANEPSGAAESEPQRVAPVARRMAAELGVDLAAVRGSGPRGRVTADDVQAASEGGSGPATSAPASPAPLPRLRRLTADRMTLSQQAPQFDVFREVNTDFVAALVERVRRRSGSSSVRVGFNDVLVKAYARTLTQHPRLNAAVANRDGALALTEHDAVHVGLAVATDAGLVVPVIRQAASVGLAEIASERVRLVAAAHQGALAPADLTGSTTTLSSLAGFAIDGFNAMVNPPQAAILAVGPSRLRPVVRDGAVVSGKTITLTLTVDHRVVDGAESAAALATVGDLLESDAELAELEET